MNKRKPKVGDKLVRVIQPSYGRSAPTRQTVVVYKVGRKYFSVGTDEDKDRPRLWSTHHVDSWLLKDCYGYRSLPLYENEQEIDDAAEADALFAKLRSAFGGYGSPKFTLDQLRKVNAILWPS